MINHQTISNKILWGWIVTLPIFGLAEWAHPGFVSLVFPFYWLFVPPIVLMLIIVIKSN